MHFNDLIRESISKNMIIAYKDGKVFIYNNGNSSINQNKEYLHYHFVSEKSMITFSYPSWKRIPDEFYITRYGFFTKREVKFYNSFKMLHFMRSMLIYLFKTLPSKFRKRYKLTREH